MKRHRTKTIDILIFALTFHVFWVNIKLLYNLNFVDGQIGAESTIILAGKLILAGLFSLSYSTATVSIIRLTRMKQLITTYAVLDAFGVLLYYFAQIPDEIRAIYFAVYTFVLIRSTIFLDNPEYMADQIREMKNNGVTQREIAQKLKISESMVSRIMKRKNGASVQ